MAYASGGGDTLFAAKEVLQVKAVATLLTFVITYNMVTASSIPNFLA